MCGDEVVFHLETHSVAEAEAAAMSAAQVLPRIFSEDYQDVQELFRIEAFLARDLSRADAAHPRALVAMTRRLLPLGGWEAFPMIKGNVNDTILPEILKAL